MKSKLGRNDPCPCGSGDKYKRCCMGASPGHPAEIRNATGAQTDLRPQGLDAVAQGAEVTGALRCSPDIEAANAPRSRTDLAEAESSLLVHLELYSWLGNEAAMALAYDNLCYLYRELGDLEAAEAMQAEASKLNVILSRGL